MTSEPVIHLMMTLFPKSQLPGWPFDPIWIERLYTHRRMSFNPPVRPFGIGDQIYHHIRSGVILKSCKLRLTATLWGGMEGFMKLGEIYGAIHLHCTKAPTHDGVWWVGVRSKLRFHPNDELEINIPSCAWLYCNAQSSRDAERTLSVVLESGFAVEAPPSFQSPGLFVFTCLAFPTLPLSA